MPRCIIWLDDDPLRLVPYVDCHVCRSVNGMKQTIQKFENECYTDFLLDLDHDLGEFAEDGGDGYELVKWLIETGRNNNHYQVKLHTMNVVGRMNMQQLLDRYW